MLKVMFHSWSCGPVCKRYSSSVLFCRFFVTDFYLQHWKWSKLQKDIKSTPYSLYHSHWHKHTSFWWEPVEIHVITGSRTCIYVVDLCVKWNYSSNDWLTYWFVQFCRANCWHSMKLLFWQSLIKPLFGRSTRFSLTALKMIIAAEGY